MRLLASRTKSKIALIEYNLAPEYRFPAAHDDCLNVTKILLENLSEYDIDEDSVFLAGDSAGGNIALSTALSLKEKCIQKLKKIILIYPMVDPYGKFPSMKENGKDYIMTSDAFTTGYDMYLNNVTEKENKRINLINRDDFEGLPETHIITAELDPLRDEGEALYSRLRKSGVDAYCTRYFGVVHGFFQLSGISESANKAISEISEIINGR